MVTVDALLVVERIHAAGKNLVAAFVEREHPMVEEHYIQWISIETTGGSQRVKLNPGDKPVAEFCLADGEELVAAYEYCNIHGLWKK